MQNIKEIVPLVNYLGLSVGDEELNHYLEAFGKKPDLKITEDTASLSYKKYGLSLGFIDQERAVGKGGALVKGIWMLRNFFLYANGYEGFDQYKGPLPGRVAFFDHRAMVQVKLGEPHSTAGGNKFGKLVFPVRDEYRSDSYSMAISYQDGKVVMVDFMMLQEADRLAHK